MKPLSELKKLDLSDFVELDDSYIRLQDPISIIVETTPMSERDIKLQTLTPTQYGAVKIVSNTWSAILDKHTCDLCRSLDGKTLPEGHPDYETYQNPLHNK